MKFTSEDLKVLFFDRKGKIYYNINWENNKEKFKWLNDYLW